MKHLKNSLILLLILSIFIVGCKVEPLAVDETPLSPEEEDIDSTFDEIDDLESLDEEFDINLDELDGLELE